MDGEGVGTEGLGGCGTPSVEGRLSGLCQYLRLTVKVINPRGVGHPMAGRLIQEGSFVGELLVEGEAGEVDLPRRVSPCSTVPICTACVCGTISGLEG